MSYDHISTHQEIGYSRWGKWDFLTYEITASFKGFSGIYIFSKTIEAEQYAVYVGQAKNMSERISRHKSDSMGIIKNSDKIHVLEILNGDSEMNQIELALIGLFNPPMNKLHRTGPAPNEIRDNISANLYT